MLNKIEPNHMRKKNAAITVTFGKYPPPEIAVGRSMNYISWYHVLYICRRYIQSIIQEREKKTLSILFIGNIYIKKKEKKIKTTCTVIAKQDTIVLQVLMCSWHLWPQSRVSPSMFATVEQSPHQR